ncbi:MAG: hypothetical protein LBS60_04635 [Deltaproteobacteria bacterium]|jgi:hypothetical protein|nr:hypothetical protein [Deltaproteobacteria bacterium]
MKKLLTLALGAMLALGLSMPAQAASKIDVSGWYRILHHNLVNFNRAAESDYVQSDSFFEHRLNVNVDFRPSDDVLIHWTLRAPNAVRWGASSGSNNFTQGSSNAGVVYTRAIYATITQDWGQLSIGRLEETFPTVMNGLKTLGYTYGTTYIYANPFDYKDVVDGISYTYNMDNGFGVNVYYAKSITQDTAPDYNYRDKDVDYDRFGVEPFFKWDGGGATLNIEYRRNMTDLNRAAPIAGNNPPTTQVDRNLTRKDYAFFLNPAVMQSWGDFTIRFEGKIGWGEHETYIVDYNNNITRRKEDTEGLGLYLQATYNYGSGDVNLMGWFVDGSSLEESKWDKNGHRKTHDLVDMGDFAPFLVAYYEQTLGSRVSRLGDDTDRYGQSRYGNGGSRRGALGTRGSKSGSNHWGLGLLGNHNFTDKIRFNWGIGYFRLVEEEYIGQNKDLGVEVDLGLRVQLLQGVTYETQFGYMFNGDAWRNGRGTTAIPYKDAKDTYAWLNALQFSF